LMLSNYLYQKTDISPFCSSVAGHLFLFLKMFHVLSF
jgi:hypothetical protein